jgi:hypothetical protein
MGRGVIKMSALPSRLAFSLALCGLAAPALAARPPVIVEVIVDEEDPPPPAAPPRPNPPVAGPEAAASPGEGIDPPADARPRDRTPPADRGEALFESLDAMERGRPAPAPSADGGGNVQATTQVVKVVVGGAPVVGQAPTRDGSSTSASVRAAGSARGAAAELEAFLAACANPTRAWWARGRVPQAGDLATSLEAGRWSEGGLGGLGLEYYLSDVIGLRAELAVGGFDRDEDGHERRGLRDDWARPGIDGSSFDDGVVYRGAVALTAHLLPARAFDLYGGLGVAHHGWALSGPERSAQGGAGFVRVTVGVGYHFHRLFVAADAHWHPWALYRLERAPGSDELVVQLPEGSGYDPRRVTAGLRFGVRF